MVLPKIAIVGAKQSITILLNFLKNAEIKIEYIAEPENADYIFIYSYPINPMLEACNKYKNKVLIFITGEACTPDFNLFDYAFGYDDIKFGDRYLQIHFQALLCYPLPHKTEEIADYSKEKVQFCNFIYSNPNAHSNRDVFFKTLNRYKKVDSLGRHLRNVEQAIGKRNSKNYFQESVQQKSPYKFSIAFENALHKGYNTEKIISSMLANTIPIFWGDSEIGKMYNTESFINCHDFKSFDKVIERIKQLDKNKEEYANMLSQPWKTEIQQTHFDEKREAFIMQLKYIFAQPYNDAFRKPSGTYNTTYKFRINDYDKLNHLFLKTWKLIHHKAHLVKKKILK